MIHQQAIIDPSARLGENVHVGPFSVIGPEVEIGDGTWIGPHVVINGPTRIGKQNRIYQFSSLGEVPQDLKYAGESTRLEVGDRNTVREYCTFSRGTAGGGGTTRIGDDNLFMAYVHVAHDCQVGNKTVFANCATLAGHVSVGDYAILGGFTGIHQFCRVGAHCMTGIATITFKDVPPFLLASGNTARPYGLNLRGLKRRGFSETAIDSLRRAYKIIYRSGLKLDEALERLDSLAQEHEEVRYLADFIRQSDRGIIR
ncbi:MAG: acyl-ACP--UDP-N-acetylglucosamine O-acyltransferase [Gammaproteobacteria bacterium]|nr:acyl-ACP--UDP-N-acetylglucosamine O-acyltransferase [Gammaproteobacteria bacterium]